MAQEIETKVLDIDVSTVADSMDKLGARLIQRVRFTVDWYSLPYTTDGNHPWFLRVRSTSDDKHEITWKGSSKVLGAARSHEEINLGISDPGKAGVFFEAIGLVKYAHQEKDRISWEYKDWKFDLDTYPDMPSYLEIEGSNEAHIQEALKMLSLTNYKTSSEGELKVVQGIYGLNWYNMKF